MSNPLLDMDGLPAFSSIQADDIEPAIDSLLAENRRQIDALLADEANISWDQLIAPLEDLEERLSRAWSPVSHLNSVMNSDALRAAYNACLPKLSDYATEIGQNEKLYHAFETISQSADFDALEPAQKKVITNALRDFRLSGVHLQDEAKNRYRDIMLELSTLTTRFEENILDATHGWDCLIEDKGHLAG
ncbi:MAG TPA: oligopeptidase A, partial [Gammaproteobacteria bacterium]|nr:oligopeptidase A [Gammaproteobacteria bacterium]